MKAILAALFGSAVSLGLFYFRWPLSPLELALYDQALRWFWVEDAAPVEIVIVAIDPPSLRALGNWPWPRAEHARVIEQLARHGAKTIYMDVGIFEPDRHDPENDRRLIAATAEARNVVYPMVFEEALERGRHRVLPVMPIAALATVAAGVAHAHLEAGPDGITRTVHLAYSTDDQTYWGASVELVRQYFGLRKEDVRYDAPGVLSIGDIQVPVSEEAVLGAAGFPRFGHEMMIGFIGDRNAFEHISAVEIVDGRFPSHYFDDKIVLYGSTAAGLGVEFMTPMSSVGPMSGVEVQANVITTLLRRRFVRPAGVTVVAALTILSTTSIAWVYRRYGFFYGFWVLILTLLLSVTAYLYLLGALGYWVRFTPLQAAVLLSFGGFVATDSHRAKARFGKSVRYAPDGGDTSGTATRERPQLIQDRYELQHRLGRGGTASVYLAFDTKLQEHVALKLLQTNDKRGIERLKREVRLARRLAHPNVVRVFDFGESDLQAFVAMEYIEGNTLAEVLRDQGPLDIQRGLRYASEICEGVEAAHQLPLIHRDLKPQNIMIAAHGHAKILDFGLANAPGESPLTTIGVALGTLAYMSPEQASGESTLDERSDIFSAGVVFYEVFTGRRPFTGETKAELIAQIIHADPPLPGSLRSEITEELGEVLLGCLRKKRSERFQTMREVAISLRALQVGRSL